jgi:formiminotetrahydrofolate cyclodeaminase
MEDTLELKVYDFLDVLASKAPVPGGGGASALVGAVGIALGRMVGSLTVGKPKYAAVEEDILSLMERANALQTQLCEAVAQDAAAFEPLSHAYGMPKDAEGRDAVMEACLADAAAAPLRILDLSCEAVLLLREFAEKGSRLVVSDAATGAAFCAAAIKGAAVNVKVNTRLMKDRSHADALDRHVDAQCEAFLPMADSIYDSYYRR